MQTDDAFLDQIRAHPGDHTTRLVYADWLDEQGGKEAWAKAEFLRLTAQSGEQTGPKYAGRVVQERLQQLATLLDSDWLAVVSRLAIENCPREQAKIGRRAFRLRFEFLCERRWEDLQPTAEHTVRFCDSCQHAVHYCDSIGDARDHAERGHCVAIDLGVIRRPGDLAPPLMLMGVISSDALEEEERSRPDPVSAERERRRRERQERRRPSRRDGSDE